MYPYSRLSTMSGSYPPVLRLHSRDASYTNPSSLKPLEPPLQWNRWQTMLMRPTLFHCWGYRVWPFTRLLSTLVYYATSYKRETAFKLTSFRQRNGKQVRHFWVLVLSMGVLQYFPIPPSLSSPSLDNHLFPNLSHSLISNFASLSSWFSCC